MTIYALNNSVFAHSIHIYIIIKQLKKTSMKKVLLICMMFAHWVNYAADQVKTVQQPNAELLCSWQYKTVYHYKQGGTYTAIENFCFYSDHTCLKSRQTIFPGQPGASGSASLNKWMIVKNNLILLDEHGKQQAAFCTKADIKDLMKGEKMICREQSLDQENNLTFTGVALAYIIR